MPSHGVTRESIYYIADNPQYKTEKAFEVNSRRGEARGLNNISYEVRDHLVTDIRGHQSDFQIDNAGFELVKHETRLSYEDFQDDSLIISRYYKEVEYLLQEKLGASRIFIFNHVVCLSRERSLPGICLFF